MRRSVVTGVRGVRSATESFEITGRVAMRVRRVFHQNIQKTHAKLELGTQPSQFLAPCQPLSDGARLSDLAFCTPVVDSRVNQALTCLLQTSATSLT